MSGVSDRLAVDLNLVLGGRRLGFRLLGFGLRLGLLLRFGIGLGGGDYAGHQDDKREHQQDCGGSRDLVQSRSPLIARSPERASYLELSNQSGRV